MVPARSTEMAMGRFAYRRNTLNGCARQFLSGVLRGGPQPYPMIRQRAREAGVRLSALWTAKRTLNVQHRFPWSEMLQQSGMRLRSFGPENRMTCDGKVDRFILP